MNTVHRHGTQAIVLGASMAGLLTARVLSEHFERVTIIERDPVADRPEARKGQPQTRHLHGLLASGLQLLTRYYSIVVIWDCCRFDKSEHMGIVASTKVKQVNWRMQCNCRSSR